MLETIVSFQPIELRFTFRTRKLFFILKYESGNMWLYFRLNPK